MNNSLNSSLPNDQELITPIKKRSSYPKLILENIFAFAPNKDILGGTAYLLLRPNGNILIDCPLWSESNRQFCLDKGGVKTLFLTNRDGISKKVRQIKQDLNCDLIIQEQEGYLLPNLAPITFEQEYIIDRDCQLIWTCGYSPASSCLYTSIHNGVLFSGRHLLPISPSQITALKLKKTFHWHRQLRSLQRLNDRFDEHNLQYILPGANTGYLRGQGFVDQAYTKINSLDLDNN